MACRNFGGDIPSAKYVLACDRIRQKLLCSKDVCHGITYNKDDHRRVVKMLEQDTVHPAWRVHCEALER